MSDNKEGLKKEAFVKILEFLTNNFYNPNTTPIQVILDNQSRGNNYFDGSKIVLSSELVDAFAAINVPRFIIYYHELGHVLYSDGYFKLIQRWQNITSGPMLWKENYAHLFNWIEDYYIEEKILQNYSYLTDVIRCITKLPPEYDINRIEYAFNYWYVNQAPTPALSYVDQIAFKAYITKLLTLRKYNIIPFGSGVLTNLAIKPSNDTNFVLTLIDFYNWCVSKKIFPPDKPLPKLSTPNGHLEAEGGDGDSDPADTEGDPNNPSDPGDPATQANPKGSSKKGSYSPHSHKVGQGFKEAYHLKKSTDFLKDELVQENKLIDHQLLDMTQVIQAQRCTVDGLFTNRYRKTATLQSKIILPNFYNPNRLIDQVLFKKRRRTYMNVAIYRDISGSTSGQVHSLMHEVCEFLMNEIPVDITYYLYASGDISIIQVPYISWKDSGTIPEVYSKNPLFSQLDGGTNSGAIADVITQQLSDKWLNIIITDGDLTDLKSRDNISALLKNVFVVFVGAQKTDEFLGLSIKNTDDIANILPVLTSLEL